MSRHLIDNRAAPAGGRAKHYLDIEKHSGDDGTNASAKALHSRPAARGSDARLRNYLRIERGHTA